MSKSYDGKNSTWWELDSDIHTSIRGMDPNRFTIDTEGVVDSNTLIKGQMFTAELQISSYDSIYLSDDQIKEQLITELVKELRRSDCIEFTRQYSPLAEHVTVRARIFATPNNQVQIIRTINKG